MDRKPTKKEILDSLVEMRRACAACFRVIYKGNPMGDLVDELEAELRRIKLQPGFGTRCQELIGALQEDRQQEEALEYYRIGKPEARHCEPFPEKKERG